MSSPTSFVAHRILDGKIETWILSDEGSLMPELSGVADVEGDRLLPGYEADYACTTATLIAELSETVTPGVTWYLAPSISRRPETGTYRGLAYGHPNAGDGARPVVYLSTGTFPRDALTTALHEAEHAVEWLLTDAELDILDAAVSRGTRWFYDYADDPVERRAEVVAHIGAAIEGGMRLISHPSAPEMAVVGRILDGTVGRRRLTKGAKNRRQQLLPKSQPIWRRLAATLGMSVAA